MTQQGRKRFRSIRLKFAGILFFSIALTVVLSSGSSHILLSNYLADSQRERLEIHAQGLAIEAQQLLDQLVLRLENLETHEFHRFQRISVLLTSLSQHSAIFPKLTYFDKHGEQAVKMLNGRMAEELSTPLNDDFLQQLMARPNEVLISVEQNDADFAAPAIVLTQARIGYFGDEFKGILQASIPLADFARHFSTHRLENRVELILTDQQGRILLHPQPEKILRHLLQPENDWLLGLAQPVDGHIAFGQRTVDDLQSYYSYLPLAEADWYAFAVVPVAEFEQLLQRLNGTNINLAIFVLLISSVLAHLLLQPILTNIQRIKKQTQNLAEGRLDQQVVVNSQDELSDLATSVNRLTEKLRHASAAYDSVDLMLQTVIHPLVICDVHGTIFKTNAAAKELFAVTEGDFCGQSLSHFFSQRSPLAARDLLMEMLQQPRLTNYETEIQVAGGTTVAVSFCFAHAYEEDGQDRFIVCLFKDISAQKTAEKEIAKLAYFDSLTGLPNRSLLHDRLEMAIRHAERTQGDEKRFAVMFLDLDHFKVVNDTLGHSVGDQLLQSAAKRLTSCLRQADTVSRSAAESDGVYEGEEHVLARLGGDEFIILLPMLRTAEDSGIVAEQIVDTMAKPFKLDRHEVVSSVSIGLAIYPDDGCDSETLLRCADVAMYHAKDQGRNSFYYYSEEMNVAARERLNLEHHLRYDIEHQQGFYLVYQPKINLQTNRITGMEALVRWQHDELGEVSPVHFIPIAEDSGLIVPLGKWILETACRQLQSWLEQGAPQYKIAVNLSGRQLKQPDLLQTVAEALHASGLDPQLLELELTESMLMATVEKTIVLLGHLKQLGVSLAIDDFGTGYSSLNYLKRFPIDTLKIDRSFVRDLESDRDDAAIIEAIIVMAKTLKLEVVAEGVETEFQLEFLKDKGGHLYQGFLFSKPVSAAEFTRRFID